MPLLPDCLAVLLCAYAHLRPFVCSSLAEAPQRPVDQHLSFIARLVCAHAHLCLSACQSLTEALLRLVSKHVDLVAQSDCAYAHLCSFVHPSLTQALLRRVDQHLSVFYQARLVYACRSDFCSRFLGFVNKVPVHAPITHRGSYASVDQHLSFIAQFVFAYAHMSPCAPFCAPITHRRSHASGEEALLPALTLIITHTGSSASG